MNNLNFTGNIGRDSETRFTTGGDPITSFSAALTSGYGDKKITTWLNCSIFGKRGESLAPYLKKGAQVAITGEFTARPYTSKEGVEKLSLDVRVNNLTLIGGKQESAHESKHKIPPPDKANSSKPTELDTFDDDIPFMRHGHKGAGVCWRSM